MNVRERISMTVPNGKDPKDPSRVGEIVRAGVPPAAKVQVEHIHAPVAAANAEAVGRAEAAVACPAMEAISQDLATGAIDGAGARARIIDRTVPRQLPAQVDPELLERIRAEVELLLEADPTLARLLRRA
jgi:hypothetical protein